jgi:hypothetical protein
METYVIEFVAWQMPSHFHDLLPIFSVYQSGEHHFLFAACARLGYHSARALRKRVQCSEAPLQQALRSYVEYQITQGLRHGTLPTSPTQETQWIPVNETELLAILLLSTLGHEVVPCRKPQQRP